MGKHIRWIYSSLFINFVVYSHKICQNDASPSNASKKCSHCCSWGNEKANIFKMKFMFLTLYDTDMTQFEILIQGNCVGYAFSKYLAPYREDFHFYFGVFRQFQ